LAANATREQTGRTSKNQPALFVNAFNGAGFDHYEIFKELIRQGITPDKQIINNGNIISLEFSGIKFIDVSKHLNGTLKENLESLGCEIQKGDIDHNLSCRWEDTSDERKIEVIKYLKADVLGLKEIYDMMNRQIFNDYKMNISSYISTSSMTFNQWKKTVRENGFLIHLPTLEQEKGFRESVRGGRTYKSKHRFESESYQDIISKISEGKDVDLNSIEDYMIDADVVSLYPAAMIEEFPVGECYPLPSGSQYTATLTPAGHLHLDGAVGRQRMGIYRIEYKTNKNLSHSIGGRREDGALKWDLVDSEGWYTSIDIEDMLANGYEVKIFEGWYWKETQPVFKEYIQELFKKKEEEAAAGRKGSVVYTLAKLWMNGLYGKNIQRPIYTNTDMIKTTEEYWKFWGKHIVSDLTKIDTPEGNIWMVSGTPRIVLKKEKCITKPTQMGAFILAYSRRIMLNYIKEANPDFDISSSPADVLPLRRPAALLRSDSAQALRPMVEPQAEPSEDSRAEGASVRQLKQDFYYTDTDSLQMHARQAKLIKRLGDKSLGGITDDLGDKCKIIKGVWIAPKLYMLEYLKADDDGKCRKIHYHLRGKGLDKDKLKPEHFEKMDKGGFIPNTKDFQMKKIHINRNSKQTAIPQFSIIHYKKENEEDKSRLTRTVNKNKWAGRKFVDGGSLPWC
jgi:hypothetical protein